MRRRVSLLVFALAFCLRHAAAQTTDSASLQFTIPAPDPVPAGEVLSIQALAVNTGALSWEGGSYYWYAEIYDLENQMVARTEQISPREAVAPGGVASISVPFPVPPTMFGRHLYRVFLIKEGRTLIQSDFKPFQVVERPIPPPPEVVNYRLEGNITAFYKNFSRNGWSNHQGATSLNAVGKLRDSSYLINAYLRHLPGNVFDPAIILATYYAPWGTIYAGDVAPVLGPLSVAGQGMRGAALEQRRNDWEWTVLGGQTITSQPGTLTVNGRYARSLYGAKLGRELPWNLRASINYFLSADETGSLSTDPKSPNYRGPTLAAQKNSGYGGTLAWNPRPKLSFSGAYQIDRFFADTTKAGAQDKAWRGDISWEHSFFKIKTFIQRAGPNFITFGAPAVIGNRLTYDGNLTVFPVSWYNANISFNQFRDNLDNNPRFVTTTQRSVTLLQGLQLPTRTNVNLSANLNTAQGKPSTALNNQTTTVGLSLGQSFQAGHGVSLGGQLSQFRDKNKLAHDLDTLTLTLSSSWRLPKSRGLSFGVTSSETKNRIDGSKRTSRSVGPSFTTPMAKNWTGQFWGSYNTTKNTSPKFPTDSTNASANSEFTWNYDRQLNLAFGLGANKQKDKGISPIDITEMTVSLRISYSF